METNIFRVLATTYILIRISLAQRACNSRDHEVTINEGPGDCRFVNILTRDAAATTNVSVSEGSSSTNESVTTNGDTLSSTTCLNIGKSNTMASNEWWMVRLAESIRVPYVVIYTNEPDNIKGAKVYVSEVEMTNAATAAPTESRLCGTLTDANLQAQSPVMARLARYVVKCEPIAWIGPIVFIFHATNVLNICEVQILDCPDGMHGEMCERPCVCIDELNICDPVSGFCKHGHYPTTLRNVALNKAVSNSQADAGGNGDDVVDGNPSTCVSLIESGHNYISIDFKNESTIFHAMKITLDNDTYKADYDVGIFVSNSPMKVGPGNPLPDDARLCSMRIFNKSRVLDTFCDDFRVGRYLILHKKSNTMNICEVEVFRCDEGAWGDTCMEVCACANYTSCDPVTGRCEGDKCLPGFIGDHCDRKNIAYGTITTIDGSATKTTGDATFLTDGLTTGDHISAGRRGKMHLLLNTHKNLLRRITLYMSDRRIRISVESRNERLIKSNPHTQYTIPRPKKNIAKLIVSQKTSNTGTRIPKRYLFMKIVAKRPLKMYEITIEECTRGRYELGCVRECNCANPLERCDQVYGHCPISDCPEGKILGTDCYAINSVFRAEAGTIVYPTKLPSENLSHLFDHNKTTCFFSDSSQLQRIDIDLNHIIEIGTITLHFNTSTCRTLNTNCKEETEGLEVWVSLSERQSANNPSEIRNASFCYQHDKAKILAHGLLEINCSRQLLGRYLILYHKTKHNRTMVLCEVQHAVHHEYTYCRSKPLWPMLRCTVPCRCDFEDDGCYGLCDKCDEGCHSPPLCTHYNQLDADNINKLAVDDDIDVDNNHKCLVEKRTSPIVFKTKKYKQNIPYRIFKLYMPQYNDPGLCGSSS